MGAEWLDMVARAVKSRGRIELHVVLVSEGDDRTRYWVVPFRTNSTRVHDDLLRLAPADCDEEYIEDEVETILQVD
jgi:hypothetical protein